MAWTAALTLNEPFILIVGTSSLVLMIVALIVFAFLFQRKLIQKEIEFRKIETMLNQQEIKSAYAVLEAQEGERRRIAEDLHDNLGSLLAVVKLYAHPVTDQKQNVTGNGRAAKLLEVINMAIAENRRIAYDLNAVAIKHANLQSAITQLCDTIQNSGRLEVRLFIEMNCDLDPNLNLQLYRVIQEMFNNTLKHADAKRVNLHIQNIDDYVSVIFEDDGKGFNVQSKKEGMGLKNIQTRLIPFDARTSIESAEGKGTTIVIEIPIKNKQS